MKNSLNLGFIVLVLVVLGCSCPKLDELSRGDNTTVSNTATPNSPPPSTNAPTSTSKAAISMDKYNQIKDNMTKSEVEKIIGGAGEEISSSSGGGSKFSSFKWTGDNYSTIIVMYRNDKVMSKSQFGLK